MVAYREIKLEDKKMKKYLSLWQLRGIIKFVPVYNVYSVIYMKYINFYSICSNCFTQLMIINYNSIIVS